MTDARRIAHPSDLPDLPDHLVGEIVSGEIVVSPRPGGPQAATTAPAAGGSWSSPSPTSATTCSSPTSPAGG